MLEGRCHCGAAQVTVSKPPETVTECWCSICRRYGGLWAYYPTADATIAGDTVSYAWGRKYIDYHRCAVCGCVMAWTSRDANYPECGINACMLDGFDPDAVERIVEQDASV